MRAIEYKLGEVEARECVAGLMETAPERVLGQFDAMITAIDPRGIEIHVALARRTRSDEQQGYYWSQVRPMAQHIGCSPDELHHELCCRTWGTREVMIAGHLRRYPQQTTTWPRKAKVEEMSELIEEMIRVAVFHDFAIEDSTAYREGRRAHKEPPADR